MSSVLIELHLLPSIEYFCTIESVDEIIVEKNENFIKQSFRNRCYILTSQGPDRLTIPLIADHKKVMITDVKIDYTSRWQARLWKTLESAYAKSPFFEHYADDLKRELFFEHTYLYDLNTRLLSMCLQWLRWNKIISESMSYEKYTSEGVIDMRNVISAKKDFSQREIYLPQSYQQVFGSNFASNLSLIDLVFCEGPGAAALVKASHKKN
ncbi:MAG: hypothetical protein HOP08_08670 [Cyclobacteriaceae bacterium]|nr:hypothetical protein [Cyclobacteriaceae bacterium]